MSRLQRILVTNDDGIDAPGLVVATRLAAALADEVIVVAPLTDQSGVAQSISVHRPLRASRYDDHRYAIAGTPADCVMYAVARVCADRAPDLVLSGVNWGANLSDMVMYSGTVGAVVAANNLGLDAIALSQAFHGSIAPDFSVADAFAPAALQRLLDRRDFDHDCCWSLNFPMQPLAAIRGLRFTHSARGAIRAPRLREATDDGSDSRFWLGFDGDLGAIDDPGADVVALREHYVSATPLRGTRCDEALAGWAARGGELELARAEPSR